MLRLLAATALITWQFTAGDLDPSFGSNGIVTTDFSYNSFDFDRAYALAVQGGKLVAAGYAVIGDRGDVASHDFALARYNSDGTLDTGFGTAGKVTTNRGGSSSDLAQALAVQGDDGKLVAAGSTVAHTGATAFCLVRYQPGGA